MIIRPYTEKDFQGLCEVIHNIQNEECWPHYYPNGWDESRIRNEFNPMKTYKNPLFLVSEADGKITGLIAGHDLDSFIGNEIPHLKKEFNEKGFYRNSVFYQRDIIVHKAHQRGTTGIRLFRALLKHASKTGYSKLVTRTPPLNFRGIKFFEGIGYSEIFRDDNPERIYFVTGLKKKQ